MRTWANSQRGEAGRLAWRSYRESDNPQISEWRRASFADLLVHFNSVVAREGDGDEARGAMSNRDLLRQLSKEELIGLLENAAKNWLAHDGLWFLAVEGAFGMETAIELDAKAWEKFTVIEAKRIMRHLGIEPGCSIACTPT
jgi:hypothetical protein